MKIEQINPAELAPADYNPRRIEEHQAAALRRSLDRWGFVEPIIANRRTGLVVGGHQRLNAALALALPTVPVHWVDLDESAEKALNIALNKISGDWDEAKLSELLADLERGGQDLEDLGFDADELDDLLEGYGDSATLQGDPDDMPEPPAEPITKPGDVWVLGRHRLICGDSTDPEVVAKLMGEEPVEVMLTDPPYCSGGFQEAGRHVGSIGTTANATIANDKLSTRGYLALMGKVIRGFRPSELYMFTDWRQWVNLYDCVESSGLQVRSMIVWDKGTPGMGRGWRAQHELMMFAVGGALKIELSDGAGNVVQMPRTGNPDHPTQKPVELIAKVMQVSRWAKNFVDPFAGSGTAIVAAEQEGRRCFGVELSPAFCDVAVRRWQDATGQQAVLEG